MEPLACTLHQFRIQWGIETHGTHHVISLYADDALIYLRDPKVSLPELMPVLERFGSISGLKVNWSKSCIFPLQYIPIAQRPLMQLTRLKWEYDTFRYLGVQVYHTEKDLIDGNV